MPERSLPCVALLLFLGTLTAAATSPPLAPNDCVMQGWMPAGGGIMGACWVGPCDPATAPPSTCRTAFGVLAGVAVFWCYCSGGEATPDCSGLLMNRGGGAGWQFECPPSPCLIVGLCQWNTPFGPGAPPKPMCKCGPNPFPVLF